MNEQTLTLRQSRRDKGKKTDERLYIALLNNDLSFTHEEVSKVKTMWKAGADVYKMAQDMDREPSEIMALLIDLSERGKIESRPGGIFG